MAKDKQPKTLQEAAAITQAPEPTPAPAAPTPPVATKETKTAPAPEDNEMSILEKVKLMSDLTSVCQDKRLIELIKSRSSGDRIFSIFVSAVEREVSKIMNGKSDELPKEVVNLVGYTRHLQLTMNTFRDLIQGFMRTPLVQVLDMLNKNMGGKSFDFSALDRSPPPEEPAETNKRAPQQQAQSNNRTRQRVLNAEETDDRGLKAAPGLGSF